MKYTMKQGETFQILFHGRISCITTLWPWQLKETIVIHLIFVFKFCGCDGYDLTMEIISDKKKLRAAITDVVQTLLSSVFELYSSIKD